MDKTFKNKSLHKIIRATVILLFFGVWALAGCSSTKLVQSWKDDTFVSGPFKKILVLGVFLDVNRRIYEDGLVHALDAKGGRGVAGYTLMPDIKDYDEKQEIRQAVESAGADGVIIARLMGVEHKERVVPPRIDYQSSISGRYGLYGYYGRSFDAVYQPGYTVTDKLVNLEIALFSVKNEKMVWTGNTQSVNPSSGKEITDEAVRLIVTEIKKAGLL